MAETVRYARTLEEAYLYVQLRVAEEGLGEDPSRDPRPETALTEGPGAWTLRYDPGGDGPPIEVLVRYETEMEARRDDLTFGTGFPGLIDAGQWLEVAAIHAKRAVVEGLSHAADPSSDERFIGVVKDWKFARDAVSEAAKFLPEDADRVPAEAVWTEMGRAAYQQFPDRFTRRRLESQIAECQQHLEDFLQLHTGSRRVPHFLS